MRAWHRDEPFDEWVVEVARDTFGVTITSGFAWYEHPTMWLVTQYFAAQHLLATGEGQRLDKGDAYDQRHASLGAYYDVLITDDGRFTKVLAKFDPLPFQVLTWNDYVTGRP